MDTVENIVVGASLASLFVGWNVLSYHLTNNHDMRSCQIDGIINSRFYIQGRLDVIEAENWFARHVIFLGEKLAHKKYLKGMGP